jgi:cell division septum initiation protein DivIVA
VDIEPTMLDLHHFTVRRRGYEPSEVDAVMRHVADSLRRYEVRIGELEDRLAAAATSEPPSTPEPTTVLEETPQTEREVDEILARARDEAADLLAEGRREAEALVTAAVREARDLRIRVKAEADEIQQRDRARAQEILDIARHEATDLSSTARTDAAGIVSAAEATSADELRRTKVDSATRIATAQAQSDQLLDEARRRADHIVEEARQEKLLLLQRVAQLKSAVLDVEREMQRMVAATLDRSEAVRSLMENQEEIERHLAIGLPETTDQNQVEEVREVTTAEAVTIDITEPTLADLKAAASDPIAAPDGSGRPPAARGTVDPGPPRFSPPSMRKVSGNDARAGRSLAEAIAATRRR